MKAFVIGTRASKLALHQAHAVKRYLESVESVAVEIRTLSTEGDRAQERDVALMGGKGVFVREFEEALLAGAIDCAVHSLKDVPVQAPEGLQLACYLPREDPRDVLISRAGYDLATLPRGAVAATSSPRRAAWLKHMRPDVKLIGFRGNVETRIRKLKSGDADVTFLAAAGLRRLGLWEECAAMIHPLPTAECVPAVGQGIIAVQAREEDERSMELLRSIDNRASRLQAEAERACLAEFGEGSCVQPLGAYAELSPEGESLTLTGFLASQDGRHYARYAGMVAADDGARLGAEIGRRLLTARAWFSGPEAG